MTFASSWVMGGWVSTARVLLRGELAHLSPQALDVVDRSYRVALAVRSVEAGLLRYRECSILRRRVERSSSPPRLLLLDLGVLPENLPVVAVEVVEAPAVHEAVVLRIHGVLSAGGH